MQHVHMQVGMAVYLPTYRGPCTPSCTHTHTAVDGTTILSIRTVRVGLTALGVRDLHAPNDQLVTLSQAVQVEAMAHTVGQCWGCCWRGGVRHCCCCTHRHHTPQLPAAEHTHGRCWSLGWCCDCGSSRGHLEEGSCGLPGAPCLLLLRFLRRGLQHEIIGDGHCQ